MRPDETSFHGITRDEKTNIISHLGPLPCTKRGFGYELFTQMQNYQDRVVQTIADTGETDTFGALLQRSIRTALHLKRRNLTKNDVVCLCSYNHRDNWVPFLAGLFSGIPVSSIDTALEYSDALRLVNIVKPKIFFVVPEAVDTVTECIKAAGLQAEVVVYGDSVGSHTTSFNSFLEKHEDEATFQPYIAEDLSETILILFSSGTTGLPKGICYSHQTLYSIAGVFKYGDVRSLVLTYSTLYWITGILYFCFVLFSGGHRVVVKSYDRQQTWRLIEKYKVTVLFLTVMQIYDMFRDEPTQNRDISSLQTLITGGAKISTAKLLEVRRKLPGVIVAQNYGCTEAAGAGLYFTPQDGTMSRDKPDSCGRPARGAQYKVVDIQTGKNCGPHEPGELRIKSELIFKGFYRQDASSVFDSDGWLKTGDILYYDEDHCFYFQSRLKEMLKYRAYEVFPAAIEEVLYTHPAVSKCVVVGVPHEIDGDLPLALVTLNEEYAGEVTEEDIKKLVADKLSDNHRLRGGVRFLNEMALTPSGKINIAEMKRTILNGLI